MNTPYTRLAAHIRHYAPLSESEETLLPQYIKYVTIHKKDYLLKEGQICHALYFVVKGCLRMYFIQENGVEQTTQFAIENWWMGDYFSYGLQKPSRFHIQAAENTEILLLHHETAQQLYKAIPALESYMRQMAERAYGAAQQRLFIIYGLSAEERYRQFIDKYPSFAQRIPQYMLASFLGVTPEFLSKLRSKMK